MYMFLQSEKNLLRSRQFIVGNIGMSHLKGEGGASEARTGAGSEGEGQALDRVGTDQLSLSPTGSADGGTLPGKIQRQNLGITWQPQNAT